MLIDGKKISEEKLQELKNKLVTYNIQLGLAVIQVGNDPASEVYIRQKEKIATQLGYKFIHKRFPSAVSEQELIDVIQSLNNDSSIHGIIVQMPLPKQINPSTIHNTILPSKDIDGLSTTNTGLLIHNEQCLVPCTPKGIIDLLDAYNIKLEGANVVIIGRSILVGKPLANLLINRHATVVVCHSKTQNIKKFTQMADIIIVAVGIKHFLTADMVKAGSVVIDIGINREGSKLYGDVDFANVEPKCSYITPVPGGVGPMTVYELMNNVFLAYQLTKKII